MRAKDPVGIPEVAERLRLTEGEVRRAIVCGRFVAPRWTVNGAPAWRWSDVVAWAEESKFPQPVVPSFRRHERQPA